MSRPVGRINVEVKEEEEHLEGCGDRILGEFTLEEIVDYRDSHSIDAEEGKEVTGGIGYFPSPME